MSEPGSKPENTERAGRILDAAARLVTHYGYDKTTVEDIAREAGVSKGAIYLHWRSKDALLDALFWHESSRYMEDWLARVEADPEGGTFRGMFKHVLLALEDYPYLKAVLSRDQRIISKMVQRADFDTLQRTRLMRNGFMRALQDAGAVRPDIDPEIAAYAFACFRYGLLKINELIPPENAPPFEDVITFIAEMMERTLAPEGGEDNDTVRESLRGVLDQLKAQFAGTLWGGPLKR